ncbi:MAG: hypothetical protein HY753_03995 [Nitrospirae bacterium]|nr:hypothetical protein [Nitrospirota bacterium]
MEERLRTSRNDRKKASQNDRITPGVIRGCSKTTGNKTSLNKEGKRCIIDFI